MKVNKREILYYLIYLFATIVPFGLLYMLEDYVTRTSVTLLILAPFFIVAVIISAVFAGNPHSGGPEWVFYTIIGVQVLIFLTVVWFLIRLVYKSIRNKPVERTEKEL